MPQKSLLCLGDSYTIGEGVAIHESFPYQLLQLLRNKGFDFHAPEIVAKTGWTTFELSDHLSQTILHQHYDFVTLLIGVNNQYRNLPVEDYKTDFQFLLEKAISLANEQPDKVIVLSIPDWSATPFAEGRDRQLIANEIDAFNMVNEEISKASQVHYINITPGTREALGNESLLAADKLHPSAIEYKRWAEQVKSIIANVL